MPLSRNLLETFLVYEATPFLIYFFQHLFWGGGGGGGSAPFCPPLRTPIYSVIYGFIISNSTTHKFLVHSDSQSKPVQLRSVTNFKRIEIIGSTLMVQ